MGDAIPILTPVLQGDRIPTKAEGTFGIVRHPAPVDGVLLDAGPDADPVFLTEKSLKDVMGELRMKQREGKRPR